MKKLLKKIINKLGYSIILTKNLHEKYPDIREEEFWEIYYLCNPYTMTSIERMYSLYCSMDYILTNNIEGDFVECGVWRGGSAMLMAKMLANRNIHNRKIYLFDTFEGMSEPTNIDLSFRGEDAGSLLAKIEDDKENSVWCLANLTDVKNNMGKTNLPIDNIVYVKGKVEDTLTENSPVGIIALLRLDTDWYESTKHELNILFPKLKENGVLIIDDYGHWQGCRKAVDEYFNQNINSIFLNRIDYTGRIGIKTIR